MRTEGLASMRRFLPLALTLLVTAFAGAQTTSEVRTVFQVRYVAADSVYLDAGTNAGLSEGMKLTVKQTPEEAAAAKASNNPDGSYLVATLVVEAVADTSAVCKVESSTRALQKGDVASLTAEDTQKLVAKTELGNSRKYPAVISFSEGDPLEEDVRDSIPRPPLPEVNRAVGRMGFDYTGSSSGGPASINT